MLKVLVSADTSINATGLGKYCKELCQRLHEDDRYEVAELGNFSNESHSAEIEWTHFPVEPSREDQSLYFQYNKDPDNRYGKWRFDPALLKFRPDFVIAINDPWMFAYQGMSPLREYFHWIVSPTVDSVPQREDYLSTYSITDSLCTYTDWAMEVLKAANMPNLRRTIRMGVDNEIFKPMENKAELKRKYGIPEDAFVVGTVMRNQARKLIPDLIDTFSVMLTHLSKEQREKTYLYIHTTFPDIEAWDIPRLVMNSGLSNKILFTYRCKATGMFGVSRFQDAKTYSFASNQLTTFMPSGKVSLTNEQLAEVFNLMDLYVQCASAEGFGVPIIEAAACGVECAVINYSAMKDAADVLDLHRIKKFDLHYDNANGCKRARVRPYAVGPELKAIYDQIEVNKPNYELSEKTHRLYSWSKCVDLWMKELTEDKLTGLQGKWDAPRKQLHIPDSYPDGLSTSEFIDWCYKYMMPFNNTRWNLHALTMIKNLHYKIVPSKNPRPFSEQDVFELFQSIAENYNHYEKLRTKS